MVLLKKPQLENKEKVTTQKRDSQDDVGQKPKKKSKKNEGEELAKVEPSTQINLEKPPMSEKKKTEEPQTKGKKKGCKA